jgi:hypothetical protein
MEMALAAVFFLEARPFDPHEFPVAEYIKTVEEKGELLQEWSSF